MNIRQEIRRKWKPRKPTAHKGDFGRIFILAGSQGFTGAAHLAAAAAVRSGAGLVTLGVPEKIYPVAARREAEVMVRPFPSTAQGSLAFRGLRGIRQFMETQDVLAIGPGLSQNPETQKLIRSVLEKMRLPAVIDADGLNALKGHTHLLKKLKGRAILTPHPGEFCRMFGGKLLPDERSRKKIACEVATVYRVVIVLKGHHTVIASPCGQVAINPTGNPGMASGGTGDVLTGIIAALIGQKFSLWDAARFGVFVHGLAGDVAARKVGQVSLMATDLIGFLPAAIKRITGR